MKRLRTIGVVAAVAVGAIAVGIWMRPFGDSGDAQFRRMERAIQVSRLVRPVDRLLGTSLWYHFQQKAQRERSELLKRGYLKMQTFRFAHGMPSEPALAQAIYGMRSNGWSSCSWRAAETSLVVTAPPLHLPAWEGMIRALDERDTESTSNHSVERTGAPPLGSGTP